MAGAKAPQVGNGPRKIAVSGHKPGAARQVQDFEFHVSAEAVCASSHGEDCRALSAGYPTLKNCGAQLRA
jgi:hypothetical protein